MRVSQHTAQASTKALLSTRLLIFNSGMLLVSRATQVIDFKIDCGVRSSMSPFHDVANIPRRVLGNGLMTSGAQAILLPPDPV
jgi:hypothetical protein